MSVLLCDSNCELWYTRLKELGIDFISMPYFYNEKEYYYDLGENTDFSAFYSAVRGGSVPKTMGLNPEDYKQIFEKYFSRGEDVVYISFSHEMSGTFLQLDVALKELKEKYPERKCTIFNTKSISLGAGIQVEAAGRWKQEGKSDEEILSLLEEFRNHSCVYFTVDDLMHLKRGGRLSAATAVAGTILGIKPILTLNEKGGLGVLEKASGRKRSLKYLYDKVVAELTMPEYPLYIVDADAKEEADHLAEKVKAARPEVTIVRQTVGPVIGAHAGAGTIGVIFGGDKRPIPLQEESSAE